MVNLNNVARTNRVLSKEEINRVLLEIGKYFYLSNFNITITNKINSNWKIVVSYKVSGMKNSEKTLISDTIIL